MMMPSTREDLPAGRREKYDQSRRNSRVLVKKLNASGFSESRRLHMRFAPDVSSVIFLVVLPCLATFEIHCCQSEHWPWELWIGRVWLVYPFGAMRVVRLGEVLRKRWRRGATAARESC
jgi:hypothetical protein